MISMSTHILAIAFIRCQIRGQLPIQKVAEIDNENVTRLISRSKFKDNDALVN